VNFPNCKLRHSSELRTPKFQATNLQPAKNCKEPHPTWLPKNFSNIRNSFLLFLLFHFIFCHCHKLSNKSLKRNKRNRSDSSFSFVLRTSDPVTPTTISNHLLRRTGLLPSLNRSRSDPCYSSRLHTCLPLLKTLNPYSNQVVAL
jgi:hypothetical protein